MNVYNKQSILGEYGFGKSGLLKIPFSLPNVPENTRHSQPENKKIVLRKLFSVIQSYKSVQIFIDVKCKC